MNKNHILIASLAVFALAAPAFAAEGESYDAKSKVEKTDANGTTTTSEKKVDASVDAKGNVDKTVKTEESTDPKGLMNKQTTKTKDTVKTKNGKTKKTHKKVVNGTTTEKSSETTKQ